MRRRLLVLVLCGAIGGLAAASFAAEATTQATPPPKDDYYELFKVLVDTMDQVERNYVKEVDRRELMEAAIDGLLEKLDPYSDYISPEELSQFRTSVEAEFGGIGIQVSVNGGELTVVSPLVGTPAYRAGVLAGDRIVEIEGESTEGISINEAVRRLKGKPGTEVTLTIVRAAGGREKVTISREIIHVETVMGDRRKEDDSWDFLYDAAEKIGYVRISGFSRDTARELREVLEELQRRKVRGLVLDLRFNPGGLLSSAIEISDLFVAKGRIVSTEGRNSPERVWNARQEGTFSGFPMVVLVNRYSASASEIVAACLQDHKRAVVMGERTWGKGSVQNVIELEGGKSLLKLTTAAYCRPSGKNIHRFGDEEDDEEWGVRPDKGYELRLGDAEIVGLMNDRRDRDIVRPHPDHRNDQQAGSKPGETPGVKPDETPEEQPGGTPAEKPDEQPSEKPVEKPGADAGHDPAEKPAAEAGGDSPEPDNGSEPAEASEPAAEEKPAFVDRQLEMALKYLATELARAN